LKLKIRRKPYSGPGLARGVVLLYRRNKTNGSWVVKASDGHGAYWTKAFAAADDYTEADGKEVLTFYEAQDKAKGLARGGSTASETAPITVAGALDDYEADLRARDADPSNASWPRARLPGGLLATPVQLLGSKELRKWRDGLLDKVKPATVNRLCNALCAALTLAASHDKRISREAWEIGLARLPDASRARNVILTDAEVLALVDEAYAHDPVFGLFVDTMATTGQRASQLVRLCVADLIDGQKPKLLMPKSSKGGGRNRGQKRLEKYSVPITLALAAKLKAATEGRAAEDLLLVRADGRPWGPNPGVVYRPAFRKIVASVGLDPNVVTAYALRHSSIVRALLRGIPIRLIATAHNTSVGMIERSYSAHISEHSDEVSRVALLEPPLPAGGNVVPIGGR
jgi:integrase